MERDTPCRTSHQAAGPDSGRRQCVERNHSHSHPKIYQGGATPEMATADLPLTDSTAFTSLALVFRLHRLQLKLYPIGLQAPKPWHFEKLSTPPPVTNRFNATVNKIHCARFTVARVEAIFWKRVIWRIDLVLGYIVKIVLFCWNMFRIMVHYTSEPYCGGIMFQLT